MNTTHTLASAGCELFEELARGTWERLMYSMLLSCSQGETTITDLNSLELIRGRLPGLILYTAIGRDEPQFGFDWEWFIGRPGAWYRYSVQAKKLDIRTQRYRSLRHKVGSGFQLDILKNFAVTRKTIPLYCFYNYVSSPADAHAGWNCGLSFDATQLGCTIAPLHVVESQHLPGAAKDFRSLHASKAVFPWRCLFCCPALRDQTNKSPLLPASHVVNSLPELPPHLRNWPPAQGISASEFNIHIPIELPDEEYASELRGFPKRIMVLDIDKMQSSNIQNHNTGPTASDSDQLSAFCPLLI